MRITLISLLLVLVTGCDNSRLVVLTGETMGTTYSVKIVDASGDTSALAGRIDAELVAFNAVMSTYIPDSELSRFNTSTPGTWFAASDQLIAVMAMAAQLYRLSDGAFDVTVGPLVNLWGFGTTPFERRIPGPDELAAAKSLVGFTHIAIGEASLRRDIDAYVDLSAIAKGYGVDVIAGLVESAGYTNYLVEIGGELRARGLNERGLPWRIAIERPDTGQRVPFLAINLRDMAMATSGDYRNYFEVDGERYSHTIDPATGWPITHALASVTVLAPTCAWADGMATAINVLGPERGLALAEAQGLAVFAIIKDGSGFVERHTTAFAPYL
ncbi:MAG: FAD:protein FMN transferase [Pseudomonadota bacterium]